MSPAIGVTKFGHLQVYDKQTGVSATTSGSTLQITQVYFQRTKVYSGSTKVYCGEKTRLLRVLFDSIDLLALFGVYAGIIFWIKQW